MPLVLRTAVGRTTPLSNTELDGNFTYLESYTATKLSSADYNYLTIRSNLNAAPTSGANRGYESGLDVRYLQGHEPNNVLPSITNKSSIVLRDANGDFTARYITASSFEGRSTTSGVAEQATKLQTARKINDVNFDGTAAITIYDKTKLPLTTQFVATAVTIGVTYIIDEVGSTNWVAMGAAASTAGLIFTCTAVGAGTGKCSTVMLDKLNLAATTTARASIRLNHGTAPTTPLNGDFWTTTAGQFNYINGNVKTVAYTDSNITGTSSNITGVAAIANGGTGKTTVAEGRAALDAAKRGANSDITSITGLTTALATSQGGTGMGSPGNTGNILISDGSIWTTAKPSGKWDISISGNADTATILVSRDSRDDVTTPSTLTAPGIVFDFKKNSSSELTDGGDYHGLMTFRKYGATTDWTGGKSHQLGFTDNNNLFIRSGTLATWGAWHKFVTSDNIDDYAPSKTGSGASGTWSINVSGTAASAGTATSASSATLAASATKLANKRKINGVDFDGTADITISDSNALANDGGTSTGNITIKNTQPTLFLDDTNSEGGGIELAISVQNESFIIYEPDASDEEWFRINDTSFDEPAGGPAGAYVRGQHILDASNYTTYVPSKTGSGASGTWSINVSGTAATATKLANARKINGVAFDGTQDISISIPTSAFASDVYSWAKEATKPSYSYSEITGTKPSYSYSELTGTAPTFNQDTTGNSANAPKWDGAKKYVQSSEPSGAANGDIWFKV
jgi:hypothetical protein